MRINLTLLIALIFILVTSCFKEDEMIEPHKSGDIIVNSVDMGQNYENQIYFDLFTNNIISTNSIEDWDLAFDSDIENWNIYLNSSRLMHAANTGIIDFNSVTSSEGWTYKIDKSNGNPDSTAIGKWYNDSNDSIQSKGFVYVIDLGQNENYQAMGYLKIQIYSDSGNYIIKSSKIDGSGMQTYTVNKSEKHERVFLSFNSGQIDIAPEKDKWAIKFTKYSTILFTSEGDSQEYLVAGVLINRNKCKVAIDSINDYSNINLNDTANYNYSTNIDAIGYDWKFYDFDNSTYTVVPNRIFVIKDYNGIYYKLRFIDFYNESGVKGSPEFEFVKL